MKQLNILDQVLRLHQGQTIIGYSINEEMYLRIVNILEWLLFRTIPEYPPLPNMSSKHLLNFINQPIIFDIVALLRVATQTYLLFSYFVRTYFNYNQGLQDENDFFVNNVSWILLGLCSLVISTMILLRTEFVDKKLNLAGIASIRRIEQSTIGFASNLTNYGILILNYKVIEDIFFPMVILGAVYGYFITVINIAQLTTFQFLLKILFSSLTVGSFFSLGFKWLIYSSLIMYKDSSASIKETTKIKNNSRRGISYVFYFNLILHW